MASLALFMNWVSSWPRPDGRPIDGCAALRHVLTHNHETRKRQRGHVRRAIAVYRSLVDADLLEFPPEPDEFGRRVRVNFDLQDEFALHQPLSLWAVEAVGRLGAAEASRAASDAETSPASMSKSTWRTASTANSPVP